LEEPPPAKLAVIGIAAVDIVAKAETNGFVGVSKTTAKGAVRSSLGGVGRNVAEAAHRSLSISNSHVLLISPVGRDQFATQIRANMGNIGMRTDGLIQMTDGRTPVISMVLLGDGSLLGGVADVAISDMVSPKEVRLSSIHCFSRAQPVPRSLRFWKGTHLKPLH
jgi:pseudouridylate synthase / pseudouridine kinase